MQKELKYTFSYIERCNMCGADENNFKVLGKRLNTHQGWRPRRKTGITTSVIRCRKCDLIFSSPQPVPLNIQDHYGLLPEDYWKEEYFVVDSAMYNQELKEIKHFLGRSENIRSLDIGAGIGKYMLALGEGGFDAYGLEPSESFYKMAIDRMGIAPERLKLGSLEDTEYPENSFDYISMRAVLEHLYDPSSAIIKTLSWLVPGGLMIIEVPSSRWLVNSLLNFWYKMSRADYVSNISPMHTPFHLYEFGLQSFTEHARLHEYSVVSYKYFVCETFMPKILDPLIIPAMKLFNRGMELYLLITKK